MASAKAPDPAQIRPAGRLLGPVVRAARRRLPPMPPRPADSRGRFYPETESATRTCYSRDRDRIIHSTRLPPPQAQDPGLCAA